MASCLPAVQPLLRCTRRSAFVVVRSARQLSNTTDRRQDGGLTSHPAAAAPPPPIDVPAADSQLTTKPSDPSSTSPPSPPSGGGSPVRSRKPALVGSRRRRIAMQGSQNIPFEDLPYQCFQEALKILRQDRVEKIDKIIETKERIKALEAVDTGGQPEGELKKQKRLKSLRDYAGELEVLADINDPQVKRRFEDGLGDLNKPIYRLFTQQRWEAMPKKILEQRIAQHHIVPDLLPKFTPTMDTQVYFGRGFAAARVAPGALVNSVLTQRPPRLRLQVFDATPRLLSIAVVDADVPLPDEDRFGRRCHLLAANIPWSGAANPRHFVSLAARPAVSAEAETERGAAAAAADATAAAAATSSGLDPATQLAVPWLPPHAQKGAPPHRLAVFVLEQSGAAPLDVSALRELYSGRDGFSVKSFRDKFGLTPLGLGLFRTAWDADTDAVMRAHGLAGTDIEFKPRRWTSLKPPRKARGWEAKRQGPKYRHLWKYTKRIA